MPMPTTDNKLWSDSNDKATDSISTAVDQILFYQLLLNPKDS